MRSIPELERKRQDVHRAFSRAHTAVEAGTITRQQSDAFLARAYGSTDERTVIAAIDAEIRQLRAEQPRAHHPATLVAAFSVIMVALFATLFWSTGGITGAVVLDLGQTYTEDATLNLTLEGTTRVTVSGSAQGLGDAIITLRMPDGASYLLYEHRYGGVTTGHASLPRSRYEEGETVTFGATDLSSAYLMTALEAIPLGNETSIGNLSVGEYAIKLIINDTTLSQEELPFTIVPAGTPAPLDVFESCGEACNVNLTGEATLEITVTGEASVTIGTVNLSDQGNRAPALIAPIPDIDGTGNVTIDLSAYFADADGDELLYDTSDEGAQESLDGSVLAIAGAPGTYEYVAYASDLRELTPSNLFTVTILPNAGTAADTTNVTDETNATSTETNATATENATAVGVPRGLCNHPDPNKRPLECIQGSNSTYFRPDDLFVENKQAAVVGKFTPIGNLMIRGEVIERSAGTPDGIDYQMGHADADGDFVPTVWIDSASGDLHLRGTLTEANGNIPLESGYSAIANRRGIVLALIDRTSGDLIVRGNVIPYRRSFE